MTPNQELQDIAKRYNLDLGALMVLTQRSKTHVYGWLQKPGSPHFKRVQPRDLHLLKLEMGLVKPVGIVK